MDETNLLSVVEKISSEDCEGLDPLFYYYCQEYVKLQEKQDSLETQLYITAGVLGGVALFLLFLIIVLFVKLNNGFKHLQYGDELQKRGFSTYTGRPAIESMNPAFSPSPPPFPMGGGGFDNATAGGVRVLPRNPPVPRTNFPNEKYY